MMQTNNKTKSIILVVLGIIILIPSAFILLFSLLELFMYFCMIMITCGIITMEGSVSGGLNDAIISTVLSGCGTVGGIIMIVIGSRLAERRG